MLFCIPTPAHQRIIIYIIISASLCHNVHGSMRNSSNRNTLHTVYPFHSVNESYFIHPAPKCEEPTSPKHTALATFSTVVMLLGIIGNFMVILVIQYSQLRKQPGYTLVTSLAAADLGVSLFVTTVKVQFYQNNSSFCSDLSLCVFYHITDALFPTASITHLLSICINKFSAIYLPYKYLDFVTYSRENLVVVCIWLYCLLWTMAGMITWDKDPLFSVNVISNGIGRLCYNMNTTYYVCVAICVFIIPVVIAGFLYATLLFIVIDKVQATPVPVGNTRDPVNRHFLKTTSLRPNFGSVKGVKTLVMVFAGWVICWMPHFSMILISYWSPFILQSFAENHRWLSDLINTVVSDVLPCLNSCINPFIYFKTSSNFRHSLKDSYLKLMKKPRHRAGSNSQDYRESSKSHSLATRVRYQCQQSKETVISLPVHPSF